MERETEALRKGSAWVVGAVLGRRRDGGAGDVHLSARNQMCISPAPSERSVIPAWWLARRSPVGRIRVYLEPIPIYALHDARRTPGPLPQSHMAVGPGTAKVSHDERES